MRFTWDPTYCLSIVPQALPLQHGFAQGMNYPMTTREELLVVEVKEIVRKYFPETWIWDLVPLE